MALLVSVAPRIVQASDGEAGDVTREQLEHERDPLSGERSGVRPAKSSAAPRAYRHQTLDHTAEPSTEGWGKAPEARWVE